MEKNISEENAAASAAPKNAEEKKVFLPPGRIQTIVFGAILLALFAVVLQLVKPFFTVLLWSALLYVLVAPLHEKILRKINPADNFFGTIIKNLIAAGFAIGTAVIVIVPVCLVVFQFYKQFVELLRYLRNFFSFNITILDDYINSFTAFVSELSGGQLTIESADIKSSIMSFLSSRLQFLVSFSSSIARNIGSFILSLVFLLFCLFFFFLDGHFLARLVMDLIPIRKDYTSVIVQKFKETARNLIFGYIVVALFQSVIAYIIFSVFNVKGALVFTVLVFVCVFIPMVGGSLVWLPLGISRMITVNVTDGIIFCIVSGIGISFLDNFIRPVFLQTKIQLHPLIIFFAILGGVSAFGFNGLILGPMLVIIFLTVLDLFLTEHHIEHGK